MRHHLAVAFSHSSIQVRRFCSTSSGVKSSVFTGFTSASKAGGSGAEVAPAGGVAREFQVDFDPGRLAARGLTAEDLWVALQGAGRDTGLMSVERGGVETMLRGAGFLRTEREIADLVVRADLPPATRFARAQRSRSIA